MSLISPALPPLTGVPLATGASRHAGYGFDAALEPRAHGGRADRDLLHGVLLGRRELAEARVHHLAIHPVLPAPVCLTYSEVAASVRKNRLPTGAVIAPSGVP